MDAVQGHMDRLGSEIKSVLAALALAVGLSACSGTRELGPTYFIDADRTDYIKDERDFPQLGKYDDMPPVVRRPSNVLDELKALPDRVRSLRSAGDNEDAGPDSEMVRSDIPVAKPETPAEKIEKPVIVPDNEIAKSLIGDQSSNSYIDFTLRGDVTAAADDLFDDFEGVPVQVVGLQDSGGFAPQTVFAKPPSIAEFVNRAHAQPAKVNLADLRRRIYQQKLAQSANQKGQSASRVQFANSSVTQPSVTQPSVTQPSVAPASGRTVLSAEVLSFPDDGRFVVLGRINADGLLLSALAAGTRQDTSVSVAEVWPGERRTAAPGVVDVTVFNRAVMASVFKSDPSATVLAAR